ncbi:MAG TPA: histidinol dehydrogenase [Gaiellaceae bacterium]|nr:histidinol dehydrogenase [Gaiellaceae bacterium]
MAEYVKRGQLPPSQASEEVKETVSAMLARIEREGMAAIRDYSQRLDNWNPPSFRVAAEEIEAAGEQLGDELRAHIAFAQDQVRTFAQRQLETLSELEVEIRPGVTLGHRHIPVAAVGSYVPGGRYPMLASAFMTVLTPKVAGVERVVAVAPPWQGRGIHPAMLYAMATSGADDVLCIGGVQALALLVFGGDDVEPVDMIVGAGNAYVAEAKRQLFGRVGIDLLAGPTEILVVADESADPELVAADLLGQAEHGPTSPAVLISLSRPLVDEVLEHIERLLASESWPTADVAAAAWRDYGTVVVVDDDDEAIAVADDYASEHLEVQVEAGKLELYRERLRNYGSLFLGEEATVVYGDKAVGTNHVLPTMRAARYTGGLWVGKFLKTVTWQRLSDQGTRVVAPAAAAISDAELFGGHALTARLRLERLRERV